ncbi:MAG: hypothetical protein ACOZCO_08605 [Bacteroidota bacterium]
MSVYLITYDLNKIGKNYEGLLKAIEDYPAWWHYMKNCWLISTNQTYNEVFNKLKPHMDDGDNLLIIEVTKNYIGWLDQKAWDWMKDMIK